MVTMKRILLFLMLAVAGYSADAANDLILSQRKADNSGNIQRNVTAVANSPVGFNGSSVPVVLTAFTHNLTTGAVGIAAGGTNQNVTITPSGTGSTVLRNGTALPTPPSGFAFQLGTYGIIDNIGDGAYLAFRRTNTSAASPSAIQSGNTLAYLPVQGYKATAYSGDVAKLSVKAAATWTDSSTPTEIYFGTTTTGSTSASDRVAIYNWGGIEFGLVNASTAAWGTGGVVMRFGGRTWTDTSSSGTVAAAVAASYGQPTFAASSATTFTNAANLYIAGDVANGTNVTLTNSYGLWNVGKTRLDGTVVFNGITTVSTDTLSGAGAVSVTKDTTKLTSTGVAQAITLANGVDGQIKHILHDVDGGSMVLAPTTKTGFSTVTFTNVGDTVTLEYATTRGWFVISNYGAVVAP